MDLNKKWMSTGKTGCTFAALFAKNPEKVGWVTIVNPDKFSIPPKCFILSIQFASKTQSEVIKWALENGFYLEDIGEGNKGLRYKIKDSIAWVQYFGLDSHVKTRQSPVPELMMCVRLPKKYYFKVGFNGILHLAHASIQGLKDSISDKLWDTSYSNTKKRLGHSPTLKEASKTTFI